MCGELSIHEYTYVSSPDKTLVPLKERIAIYSYLNMHAVKTKLMLSRDYCTYFYICEE